jgi:hypothetical protein
VERRRISGRCEEQRKRRKSDDGNAIVYFAGAHRERERMYVHDPAPTMRSMSPSRVHDDRRQQEKGAVSQREFARTVGRDESGQLPSSVFMQGVSALSIAQSPMLTREIDENGRKVRKRRGKVGRT